MSEALRIALVAEGITDLVVIRAAVESILGERPYQMRLLQPEESVAFTGSGAAGELGGGWKGVFKWCRQVTVRNNDSFDNDVIFLTYDMLILHLDADVANEQLHVTEEPIGLGALLPCSLPCPPARDTADALRQVMLSWLQEPAVPSRTVFCIPSQNTEAWVMMCFFPEDIQMRRGEWECHAKPENRLAQQPKIVRFGKNRRDYDQRRESLRDNWPSIVDQLPEALRFQEDFLESLKVAAGETDAA